MTRWTEAALNAFRMQGDELADEVVARLAANLAQSGSVRTLLDSCVANDQVPDSELPTEVRAYFEKTELKLDELLESTLPGQHVFEKFGPEILVILGCYALPASYAATKGVKVLAATGYLGSSPTRRLGETTQMVIDVLSPGGLGPNGKGVRTAQKVRLMHATIRHLLQKPDTDRQPWDVQKLGVPINQEDLAGTLMTFSYLVLDGLEKLGCRLTNAERQSYLATWMAVGRILGVKDALIPASFEEAKELTEIIQKRQTKEDPEDQNVEGRNLMAALLGMYKNSIPGDAMDFFAAGMVRFFLPNDVANRLGVPALSAIEKEVVAVAELVARGLEGDGTEKVRSLVRRFGLDLVQALLLADRGGKRPSFSIPAKLRENWKAIEAAEPPWWVRMWEWLVGLLGQKQHRA
ncbi:MAG: oxygenase MpaB family protein [Polyangiaceae bacterium]|nr:oxygenase MpaB family protein [Polyangiaceae bacterium]